MDLDCLRQVILTELPCYPHYRISSKIFDCIWAIDTNLQDKCLPEIEDTYSKNYFHSENIKFVLMKMVDCHKLTFKFDTVQAKMTSSYEDFLGSFTLESPDFKRALKILIKYEIHVLVSASDQFCQTAETNQRLIMQL